MFNEEYYMILNKKTNLYCNGSKYGESFNKKGKQWTSLNGINKYIFFIKTLSYMDQYNKLHNTVPCVSYTTDRDIENWKIIEYSNNETKDIDIKIDENKIYIYKLFLKYGYIIYDMQSYLKRTNKLNIYKWLLALQFDCSNSIDNMKNKYYPYFSTIFKEWDIKKTNFYFKSNYSFGNTYSFLFAFNDRKLASKFRLNCKYETSIIEF